MIYKHTEYLKDIENWIEEGEDNIYFKDAVFNYSTKALDFITYFTKKENRDNLYVGNIQAIYEIYNIAMNVVESYNEVKNKLEEYKGYSKEEERKIVFEFELKECAKENEVEEKEVMNYIILCEGCAEVINKIEKVLDSETTRDIVEISQTLLNTNLIPSNIRNVDATSNIASYFEDGRVDNYREAINLYHSELIQRSK